MVFYLLSIQLYLEAKPFDQKAHYGKRWKDWDALLLKEKKRKKKSTKKASTSFQGGKKKKRKKEMITMSGYA